MNIKRKLRIMIYSVGDLPRILFTTNRRNKINLSISISIKPRKRSMGKPPSLYFLLSTHRRTARLLYISSITAFRKGGLMK